MRRSFEKPGYVGGTCGRLERPPRSTCAPSLCPRCNDGISRRADRGCGYPAGAPEAAPMRARTHGRTLSATRKEAAMRVADVMTTEVLAVKPDASLKEVAELLSKCGISGLPVVDVD